MAADAAPTALAVAAAVTVRLALNGRDFAPAPTLHRVGRSTYQYYDNWQLEMSKHGVGLEVLDHLTHNVMRGNMNVWAGFYENIGNFREIRYFDIEGKLTGLVSKAMTAPCGKCP